MAYCSGWALDLELLYDIAIRASGAAAA